MNEKTLALIAEMYAIMARIDGMKADNIAREHGGFALAWNGDDFFAAEKELTELAGKIRGE